MPARDKAIRVGGAGLLVGGLLYGTVIGSQLHLGSDARWLLWFAGMVIMVGGTLAAAIIDGEFEDDDDA